MSSNHTLFAFLLTISVTSLCSEFTTVAADNPKVIGVIINRNTRIGREQNISMAIAVQTIPSPITKDLVLRVTDSGGNPILAMRGAESLLEGKQIEAIVGMATWQEAVLVAEVASKAEVVVVSLSAPSIAPPQASEIWPHLVRMGNNQSAEMRCVASIVGSYGWRKVVAIYEHDGYITDSGILSLLSDELQAVGSEIELRLTFPPSSSLSDPKTVIRRELERLNSVQSRVFVIIGSSLELAIKILAEAKEIGLMGKDSVWITSESITNLFHSLNSSLMPSMQGVIGIKTYFPHETVHFQMFSNEFTKQFQSVYPEEEISKPGIHALHAYDSISTVLLALANMTDKNSTTNSRMLLENILTNKFEGLSGEIKFQNGELSSSTVYEIVNVFGQSYDRLKFWSSESGFSDHVNYENSSQERDESGGSMDALGDQIHWPGGLYKKVPKGWLMPTDAKPIVIGVPADAAFDQFVKWNNRDPFPTGFCIELFNKSVQLLQYDLPYKFKRLEGAYTDLVVKVYSKEIGAVVGDVTILSKRTNFVDFTQPFAESGLSMVVPVKAYEKSWLFTKPFKTTLWLALALVFVYTMFVIWFLEHRSNPEFMQGSRRNQLSTAMWFTFSTLFIAHSDSLRSSYTRVVLFVWLFVVFVIISSYQASLTSMLTVQSLEPTVTDIDALKRNNSRVGCDRDSFIPDYLEKVLQFDQKNIVKIPSQYGYLGAFRNETIKAAFLELPYSRVFLSNNAKEFKDTGIKHRFGGFGFAFPKGSPLAKDFSKAFLDLSEDGTLDRIHKDWFPLSTNSEPDNSMNEQRLAFTDFRELFLITGLTSTLMLVLYVTFGHHSSPPENLDDGTRNDDILMSTGEEPGPTQPAQLIAMEMQETDIMNPDNQTRPLRLGLANSFPAPGRHIHGYNHSPRHRRLIPYRV